MTKDFDKLRQQLVELAEAVNRFESESVQLRVVELVLTGGSAREGDFAEGGNERYVPGPGFVDFGRGMRSGRRKKTTDSARGAVAALNDLIESDFFTEPRTISDIVARCEGVSGARYKSNAFSGPLSRHARSGILNREKNEDGKFVYSKPS
ncbi:hypothetical protein [Nitratireductor sp. ZSWI3]|uniref:hypothetical protein n=1 Tax=Nitratireductor sp. ZSWI3 TaxID=2966359 RepID=UPI00214FCEB7|nr:hypothetical protein [Nitratireductor sp. ZSWI3]MCR4267112.1 hypothetical protein [Nitratireductor sp. ZSWI3]